MKTEKCESIQKEEEERQKVLVTVTPSAKKTQMSREKQSLFVEFIQFLIRIGMFNKDVVMSMLENKELFM